MDRVVRPGTVLVLVTEDGLGLPDWPRRLRVSVVMRLGRVSELGLSDGPGRSGLGPGNLPGATRPASGQEIGQEERL